MQLSQFPNGLALVAVPPEACFIQDNIRAYNFALIVQIISLPQNRFDDCFYNATEHHDGNKSRGSCVAF